MTCDRYDRSDVLLQDKYYISCDLIDPSCSEECDDLILFQNVDDILNFIEGKGTANEKKRAKKERQKAQKMEETRRREEEERAKRQREQRERRVRRN